MEAHLGNPMTTVGVVHMVTVVSICWLVSHVRICRSVCDHSLYYCYIEPNSAQSPQGKICHVACHFQMRVQVQLFI